MFNVAYGVGKAACDRMAADCAHELKVLIFYPAMFCLFICAHLYLFFSLKEDNVTMVSLWPGPVKTEHIVEHVLSQGKFEIQFS